MRVVGTPGHSSDSLSFVLPAERAVLTGDTVLGRGTTVVAHPDGRLGAYLDSLHRLHALAEAHEIDSVWPGHGPVIERLEQVRRADMELSASSVAPGDGAHDLPEQGLARAVVEKVYADVDPILWGAAELSVRAQLAYLRAG